MKSEVRRTLELLVSNFSLDNTFDYHIHQHAVKGLQTEEQISHLRRMAEEVDTPKSRTHEDLEEMYREVFRQSIESAVKVVEFKELLLAIDFKFSLFVKAFEEVLSEYEDYSAEPLSEFFARIGVTPNHHIFHYPEDDYRWRREK